MLLSVIFSNDSSLFLKFIERGVYQGLATAKEDAGRCIICLLGSQTQLSLLKLLFHYLLKGQWGHKPMFKDKILLSRHIMVQGQVRIPWLYRDTRDQNPASPGRQRGPHFSRHCRAPCGICTADGRESLQTGSCFWVPSTLTALGLCHYKNQSFLEHHSCKINLDMQLLMAG